MIVLDDENDLEVDEQSSTDLYEKEDPSIVNNLIGKIEINTEVIVVKPNLPTRICTTAVAYFNPQDAHIIMVGQRRIFWPNQKDIFFSRCTMLIC